MNIFERIQLNIILFRHRRENADRGAAAVEYAPLLAGMAVVVCVAVFEFGGRLTAYFGTFGI